MLPIARTGARVSRVAALAAVLTFGALPADAGESTVRVALEAPGASLLSGLQGCGHALGEGMPEGSRCLGAWSVNQLLLDAATRFATEHGRAVFGEHFRIVNSLSYSSEGSGLGGGIDIVLPLAASTPGSGTASETGAFFLQQGVTRWVDDRGFNRKDFRLGAVRRFSLSGEDDASGLLVDYFDEPVPVVIRAGTSSAIVNVQLPLNAELNESRSLSVTVALAS